MSERPRGGVPSAVARMAGRAGTQLFLALAWVPFVAFPFGTLGVNVVGSFLASAVMVLALERSALGPDARLVLVTGVLGGFTTYSSFNHETIQLARSGAIGLAATFFLIAAGENWSSPIGPMMPWSLRAGVK